uniref:Alpha/beta hydrolase family n=1 Tax=Candidatus Kentrum sp. TUN TaxID=2126343 RepID=A0A450ZQS7_9GAMM|nr:MAG: Alpha/beta hydrolase family [Candidatus Kentron sp. TUN]VFK56173.1 MAG: Alpha/beta hydrolase family [Candidatus Kentron sp. TUN]VFK56329.1 MAG: Alpha/beta hydrolase family [Candidatus Kentron sp. TUN]
MSAFREDLAAVVNKTAENNIILVGYSRGGSVVIKAASLLGEKMLGIIGVDIFFTSLESLNPEEQIEEFIKPFKNDFKTQHRKNLSALYSIRKPILIQ